MTYQETDLIRIAKRENNNKRAYLVVNPLQGKHIPVSPGRAFQMMDALAKLVKAAYPDEKLLLAGFAETATAIGARLAVKLESGYIQTTREQIPGADYLYFTESHSHATEQKLVKNDLGSYLSRYDRLIFVEDEVTTGNTILNIVKILERLYPGQTQFAVASLLNGMDADALSRYRRHEIAAHYLLKTDHSRYPQIAQSCQANGSYIRWEQPKVRKQELIEKNGGKQNIALSETMRDDGEFASALSGYQNARKFVEGKSYGKACEMLWAQIQADCAPDPDQKYLVLGTEEFMYPPLYAAFRLEQAGCFVRSHATTRSPIAVSAEREYPLHVRYELPSLYEESRRTFVYDLAAYDQVFIISDATGPASRRGAQALADVLRSAGSKKIKWYRWCEDAQFL